MATIIWCTLWVAASMMPAEWSGVKPTGFIGPRWRVTTSCTASTACASRTSASPKPLKRTW